MNWAQIVENGGCVVLGVICWVLLVAGFLAIWDRLMAKRGGGEK